MNVTLDDIRIAIGRLSPDELAELDSLLEPPEGSYMCVVVNGNRDAELSRYFGLYGHLPEILMNLEFIGPEDATEESVKNKNSALADLLKRR